MGKKAADILKGEIVSSIFYIAFGLCLILIPDQTVNLICKLIFGVVMISTGLYHIYIYTRERENATILDLFSGVISLVLGGFLFMTPQIVIKILPYLLSAFVLVDSIWTLKGSRKLKKLRNSAWKVLLGGSLIFIILGLVMMFYPFSMVKYTVIFSGCVFLANGIGDIVFLILLHLGIKKGTITPSAEKQEADEDNGIRKEKDDDNETEKELRSEEVKPESDIEEPVRKGESSVRKDAADEDRISSNRPEDETLVSPAREIKEMEKKNSFLWNDEEQLEEWKD